MTEFARVVSIPVSKAEPTRFSTKPRTCLIQQVFNLHVSAN